MANRILRDWTDSERIDALSVHAERFLIRLFMVADDYGHYPANPQLIKSNCFPLKSNIRATDISLWLAECKKDGLITTYFVASKEYLQIENFNQRLRNMNYKYPAPDNLLTDGGHHADMPRSDDGLKRNETKQNPKRNEIARTEKFGNVVLYDLNEINEKLSFDQVWLEAAAMNHRVELKVVQKAISEFVQHLAASGIESKGLQDAKSHFNNWFPKRFAKQDDAKNSKNVKQFSTERVGL